MKQFKYIAIMLALALALAFAVLGVVLCGKQNMELAEDVVVVETQATSGRQKVPYYAFLEVDDLTASTWYSLVDLSDATNFPHFRTSEIILKQLHYTGVLSDVTHMDLKFGVVITIGDEASLIRWFHTSHRLRATQFDEKWTLPEHGLNLYADETAEELRFVATTEYTTTVAITTTTALESPVTEADVVTTTADVGDLILYIEEIDAGAHADFSIGTAYNTE